MIVFVIFILLGICFCIVERKGSQIPPAHKTEKIANASVSSAFVFLKHPADCTGNDK